MGLCQNPTFIRQMIMPCGQCLACRINRRREWAHRMMLEASQHQGNIFVTLTYDDDHLPEGGTLEPDHLKQFWKNLRNAGRTFRYYAVGEYGDETRRPHYHAAIFGIPTCRHGRTRRAKQNGVELPCCSTCDLIQRCWIHGGTDVGTVERASASYICGYVIKKLSDKDDPRHDGRHPEFSRMSLKPGIGSRYVPDIADRLLQLPAKVLDAMPDVPRTLRHGGRPYPLGRYLTRLLRAQIGRSPDAPDANIRAKEEEVQLLRAYASQTQGKLTFSQVYKSICLEVNAPAYSRMEYMFHLKRKRRGI